MVYFPTVSLQCCQAIDCVSSYLCFWIQSPDRFLGLCALHRHSVIIILYLVCRLSRLNHHRPRQLPVVSSQQLIVFAHTCRYLMFRSRGFDICATVGDRKWVGWMSESHWVRSSDGAPHACRCLRETVSQECLWDHSHCRGKSSDRL